MKTKITKTKKRSVVKTATLVKDNLPGWLGHAALYRVSPKLSGNTFVIVSSVSGPETYIFPATKHGEVKDWGELEGSFRGQHNHARALGGAGYVIA